MMTLEQGDSSLPESAAREKTLFANIKAQLPDLDALREKMNGHWQYEDMVYRYYHGSFKVFRSQDLTLEMVAALRDLLPEVRLNDTFEAIVTSGTGKDFTLEDNSRWDAATRPILEAFFHAKYFVEMICRYGHALDAPPETNLPSGWASVLYLYGLR